MKAYVIDSAEALEAGLAELPELAPKTRQDEITYCGQDEKDLFAFALDSYAEAYCLKNPTLAEHFRQLAARERQGH